MLGLIFWMLWPVGLEHWGAMFEVFRAPFVWVFSQEAMLSLLDEVNLYLLPLQAVAGLLAARRVYLGLHGKEWYPQQYKFSAVFNCLILSSAACWAYYILPPPNEMSHREVWVWAISGIVMDSLPALVLIYGEFKFSFSRFNIQCKGK